LLPENLHKPLEQGFIITKRAKNSSLARSFATFFEGPTAQNHLKQCGFTLVGAGVTKKAM
jgi:molybdate transport system substrate-binding protein